MNTSVTVGQPGSSSAEPSRQAGGAPLHRRLASSPALRVVGRRLLIAIPVLWGVTFLTFVVLNALPGDAASALLGANATPQEVQALSIKLHLNEPFLVRYGHWLGGVLHGDLGTSLYYNQPVTSILAQRLPVTIELVVYALVITFVVSVPLAVLSARRPRGVTDRASMALSMGSLSIAPYVLALLLILVFAVDLRWLPALAQGTGGDIRDLTLPAVTLAVPLIGFYTRFLRADLLEQMQSEDYTVTALAKGLSRGQVLMPARAAEFRYRAGHGHRAQPRHPHRGDGDRGTDLRVVRHRIRATQGDQQPGRAPRRGHRAGLRHHRRPRQPRHRPALRRARPKDPSWPFP